MTTAIELQIRDARNVEREEAIALTIEAYRQYEDGFGQPFWSQYISNIRNQWEQGKDARRIVAEHDGKLLGAVLLYPPQEGLYEKLAAVIPYPEVRLLGVHPGYRGSGIATALLRDCAQRALNSGYDRLGLHTSQRMPDAVRLYRKLGFERAPEFDFPAADQITLVEAYRYSLHNGIPW
ncbi:GNAT family N-acetyltransferase [Paenibacillus chartarius]|uniref:GNAT family N-acetyltransferase n=1 Tax=Paenibacillus chartarius TaxID=747481 RepID=A0ABV6DTG0_9BACL